MPIGESPPVRLRAAVVGCGWIGSEVADDPRAQGIQAHAAAYVACEQTELVAVCDADSSRMLKAAQRWNVSGRFTDCEQLLQQSRPDIVSVCTPDAAHAAVIRAALDCDSVKAIVAEKPIAASLEEARQLVQLAEQRGVLIAVNYLRRLTLSHQQARERIAAGELGTIQSVQGSYTKGVAHNGTHWFDLARWFMGDVVSAQAWASAASPYGEDPTCHVRLQFASGASAYLQGLDSASYTVFEMDICGTRGRLKIEDSGMQFRWSEVAASPHYSNYQVLRETSSQSGSYADVGLRLIEDVVDALRNGREPRCTGKDAMNALAVAHAARRSLEVERAVLVEKG